MINNTQNREPVQEILSGGVVGGILGGLITFALYFGFADSVMLAAVMAMQGALTGAMGLAWAVAMLLARTEGEQSNEIMEITPVPVQATSQQSNGFRRVA